MEKSKILKYRFEEEAVEVQFESFERDGEAVFVLSLDYPELEEDSKVILGLNGAEAEEMLKGMLSEVVGQPATPSQGLVDALTAPTKPISFAFNKESEGLES